MRIAPPLVGLAVIALAAHGCGKSDSSSGSAAPPSAAAPTPAPEPKPLGRTDVKPEYAVEIRESAGTPKTYAVAYSAKVPTGGWKFIDEKTLVEDSLGKLAARIYVTLEAPAADEMVTQAEQTVTGLFDAGARHVERVEFSVKRTTRNEKTDYPALYSVVKTIKYPYD